MSRRKHTDRKPRPGFITKVCAGVIECECGREVPFRYFSEGALNDAYRYRYKQMLDITYPKCECGRTHVIQLLLLRDRIEVENAK
jgi:hypothetical protein